jgi:hypothetical protein
LAPRRFYELTLKRWNLRVGGQLLAAGLTCLPSCLQTTTLVTEPSGDEILAKVADSGSKRLTVPYSAVREYRLRNFRFGKEAVVLAQMKYDPPYGKQYTLLEQSGNTRLVGIIEKLLTSEVDASQPAKVAEYEVCPSNYRATFRGLETSDGRSCFVIDVVPKHRSKYLIKGTLWVDRASYGIARLEGTTSSSVSVLVGAPYIQQEFSSIDGLWLPIHTGATSSGFLLGTSHLEIVYRDYSVAGIDRSSRNTLEHARPRQSRERSAENLLSVSDPTQESKSKPPR